MNIMELLKIKIIIQKSQNNSKNDEFYIIPGIKFIGCY